MEQLDMVFCVVCSLVCICRLVLVLMCALLEFDGPTYSIICHCFSLSTSNLSTLLGFLVGETSTLPSYHLTLVLDVKPE